MPTQMPIEGLMLGAALTVVGLIISWVVWRRRGTSAGLRAVAWSLLPLAAGLLGLMTVLGVLVRELVRFFTTLVFDPLAWAGVALTGLAVVLWITGRALRGRSAAHRRAAEPSTGERPRVGDAQQQRQAPSGSGDDDLADIEALLRKRGIE